ncbi:Arc family DNA-binding protein [Acidobacteria bacterium ACD]|nr:MAG: Arc family DNA-binding protein [Acidobacteriota bacterium]MCE7957232.1 Arc family DNA-binding protein [Acidobacteria bacterium ACB2]MDL1950284.1 Arc family DNA-binding protein [Acidobacteria bacterium ACD]
MPSITLKDVPDDVHAALKAEAAAHGRSLNREIIQRLRLSLVKERRPRVDEILARAARHHRRMRGVHLTDEELEAAIESGRP